MKPAIKSLYVHSLNEGLIYHFFCCFFYWVLIFYTFLLKILLRDVLKLISKNAFVPYTENKVKQSKIPYFRTLVVEVSQGCIWLWRQGNAQISMCH